MSHGLALPLISCTIFSEDLRGGSRAEEGKNGQHKMIDRDFKKKTFANPWEFPEMLIVRILCSGLGFILADEKRTSKIQIVHQYRAIVM